MIECYGGGKERIKYYQYKQFVAGAQHEAAGQQTVEETEREASEADVDSGPEVREEGVVSPVSDAPVYPKPEQDDHHGQ